MSSLFYIPEVVMAREERSSWILLILAVVGYIVYASIVLSGAVGSPLTESAYVLPMLIVIGSSIVLSILLNILAAMGTGIWVGMKGAYRGLPKDELEAAMTARVSEMGDKTDERDKAIARYGEYGGQAFLVIGALGALVLAFLEVDHFWIANTLFLAFTLSAVLGSILKITAYRWGMPA
jgi:hypothetical protein